MYLNSSPAACCGPPIPPELVPILFEPFRRGADASRRSDNLGLGLYITREVVQAHRGSISVESREGAGTTFRVRLPRGSRERATGNG